MTHWSEFVDPTGPDGAYLPWKKVEARVGISRTTAWRLQKHGEFPKPYIVSPGRVAYRESEVEAWKASRRQRSAPVPPPPQPSKKAPPPLPKALPVKRANELPANAAETTLAECPPGEAPPAAPRRRPRRAVDGNQIAFDF